MDRKPPPGRHHPRRRQRLSPVPVGKTGRTVLLRFGAQVDTRVVRSGTAGALTGAAVANYIAKYATKAAGVPGLPDSRIRRASEIALLRCPGHHKQMMAAAFRLGYGKWAHMLGSGGHFLSKSRRYSVTFGQLRTARKQHRQSQRHPDGELDPWGRPVDETTVLFIGSWTYAGNGYAASDEHLLALMSADNARKG